MRTKAKDKEILTVEETIEHYTLSRRKFHALLHEGSNSFSVKYYNGRTLILKPQFEEYLDKHPEVRRRAKA
jgi:hypothetical protein